MARLINHHNHARYNLAEYHLSHINPALFLLLYEERDLTKHDRVHARRSETQSVNN